MMVRGIRGATTVTLNDSSEILLNTEQLLQQIVDDNQITPSEIGFVFITVTDDLNAVFPARAIRQMPEWELVPLMCAREIPVPDSLPLCIRVMLQVNTEKAQSEMVHVYQNEAVMLRPDLLNHNES